MPDTETTLILIEHGEVYTPQPQGRQDVLLINERIVRLGPTDRRALEALRLNLQIINAAGCVVTPGLIDPHQHLLGGSGERGFSTQTPEIFLSEIVSAGITTVVGCLGVDTSTKTMPGLLARAKALGEEGLTVFIYSGGYNVPPVTLTGSVRDDLVFIAEVIGAGEIAIADERGTQPSLQELARLVSDAYVGGLLSGKAGITHFHIGARPERLKLLRALLQHYAVKPEWLYPTHVERNESLMQEAIRLAREGAFVDVDTMEEDLPKWLRFYLDQQGPPERLTVSSDAAISSPRTLYEQFRACVLEHGFPLELVLTLLTANTAQALRLQNKGKLAPGCDADVLVLRRDSLELVEVIAKGRRLLRAGQVQVREKFLEQSNRRITLHGGKQS
jgi:beta-aspartyl-dipeptidase (metallo-type)